MSPSSASPTWLQNSSSVNISSSIASRVSSSETRRSKYSRIAFSLLFIAANSMWLFSRLRNTRLAHAFADAVFQASHGSRYSHPQRSLGGLQACGNLLAQTDLGRLFFREIIKH